jgi:hypothetical protein
VVQLVEALCHKTGGAGFDPWWGPWKISSDQMLLSAFSRPGSTHPHRNEYQGLSLGIKCGWHIELTTLLS